MRLGIYGGTFAPIHNAHVRVAKAFYKDLSLDKLMIIPAGIPPHKQVASDDAPDKRLRMCQLAFKGEKGIEVSDLELRREGKSYTVMTLRELSREDREIFLLCGTDMLLTFDLWYCFEEIFKLCTLVYVRRECDEKTGSEIARKLEEYRTKYSARIIELQTETLRMSSTEIREAVKAGKDISDMVPSKVVEYIRANRLYGG